MKIYIMTDMEGVCGVVDHDNWVMPSGDYYNCGKALLSAEINAAIEGFLRAGAEEILVVDGHGAGGVDHLALNPKAKYLRMSPGVFPFMLDSSFDGMAHIGQHAMSGSEYAHIAHTGWFSTLEESVNGVDIGEFGQMVLCASDLGVPAFFCSGDSAFKREAEALLPGIVAVETKWGTTAGSGDDCSLEEYKRRNLSAIHLHPEQACLRIQEGAYVAGCRLKSEKASFTFPDIEPPYRRVVKYRRSIENEEFTTDWTFPSMAEALNHWE